jgi:hypothetical protein
MKVMRKHFSDLDSLMDGRPLTVDAAGIDNFIGRSLYLKRLQHVGGFDSITEMVEDLRKRRASVRGKYIDFV